MACERGGKKEPKLHGKGTSVNNEQNWDMKCRPKNIWTSDILLFMINFRFELEQFTKNKYSTFNTKNKKDSTFKQQLKANKEWLYYTGRVVLHVSKTSNVCALNSTEGGELRDFETTIPSHFLILNLWKHFTFLILLITQVTFANVIQIKNTKVKLTWQNMTVMLTMKIALKYKMCFSYKYLY